MNQPIRVLLVDDEPDFPEMAATYLEREDDRLEVVTADSPTAGLELLTDTELDCIVSDYSMPGRDGIEFLEAVRERYPNLPFVLYTARGSEQVASEAITAGVTDYFQRTADDEEYTILANRITNLADRYRLEREAEQTRSQLHAITESSADAIVTIDEDSIIRFANAAVQDLFGHDPAELTGKDLTELMPERYREDHLDAVDAYLETGEQSVNWSSVEFAGRHANGTEMPLSLSFGAFEYDGEQRFVGIIRDISERKRVEEALREREQRFRQLAENIEAVVWMSGPDNDELLYVNPAYETIWGRSVGSLYDDPDSFLEAIHPDDRGDVETAAQRQADGEYDEEYRVIRPDGEHRWVHDRAIPITDENGDVHRIVGITSDITDRKEETRRLETLISNLPGIAYRASNDPDWPMTFVGGECEPITGYTAGAIEGGDVLWGEDIIHPDDRADVWNDIQAAIETDDPFEITYRIQTATRDTRWVWERGRTVARSDGQQVLEGFITDITERKRRETRLRQYERAIESASDFIAAIDSEYQYLFANQAYREYYDLSEEELVDTTLEDDIGEDTFETTRPYLERAFEGETVRYRTSRTRPDEPTRVLEIQYAPLETDDGEVQGIVKTMRDLTEQREREIQLASLDRMLRHNLHNELNIVRGYADMIAAEADAEIAEHAATITEATDRILQQADKEREIVELLTEQSAPQTIELCGVIETIVDRTSATHSRANISTDLPETAQVTTIPELKRALGELIDNAISHCDRETPEVTVSVVQRPSTVEITVEDNGPGIPEQERKVIGDNSPIDPLVHSSGMGLWLVKRIATRAGGTLRFEEGRAHGSAATLVVPNGARGNSVVSRE